MQVVHAVVHKIHREVRQMPRQRRPMTYRFFVKDQNGNYVDMRTLSEEEQQRHRREITDRFMAQFGFERDEHPDEPPREGEIKTDSISFLTSVYGPQEKAVKEENTAAGA